MVKSNIMEADPERIAREGEPEAGEPFTDEARMLVEILLGHPWSGPGPDGGLAINRARLVEESVSRNAGGALCGEKTPTFYVRDKDGDDNVTLHYKYRFRADHTVEVCEDDATLIFRLLTHSPDDKAAQKLQDEIAFLHKGLSESTPQSS